MKKAIENSPISIINNRRVKVFLFILVLTSIIWLLVELSKTYTSSAVFNVEYKSLPKGKLLQKDPISELNIVLNAPGFDLLKYKGRKHKLILDLKNIKNREGSYYLLPNQQLGYLNSQLAGDVKIVHVLKDTVYLELGSNKSKKVPVNPAIEIKFKLGYNLIDKVKITPDSILITGPQKIVDSIKEITTKEFKIEDVYKNVEKELDLVLPLYSNNFSVSSKSIHLNVEVDKFTEGRFKIPVTVINEPEGIKMNTFPKQIEVVYQAGLSNFNKITENSFLIVYDYNQYKSDSLIKYLSPVIKQKSEFVSSLRINPREIEFLIQK